MQAKPLKALISDHGVSFDAITIMNALLKARYTEAFEYAPSAENGVMKSFRKLTEHGEESGKTSSRWGIHLRPKLDCMLKPFLEC